MPRAPAFVEGASARRIDDSADDANPRPRWRGPPIIPSQVNPFSTIPRATSPEAVRDNRIYLGDDPKAVRIAYHRAKLTEEPGGAALVDTLAYR
jgi:hypothetical protein